jgi:hypothetical protein
MYELVGHLKPGVNSEQAAADLNSVDSDLRKSYPKEEGKEPYTLGRPDFHGDYLGRPMRGVLTGLMLLSVLILLAACANLGSLFAARAAYRSREVALRLALGSSRNRILRHLLTESVLLSIAGGVAGLVGSILLLRRLSEWRPFPQLPVHVPAPEAKVYLLALVLALVSGVLSGIVPCARFSGPTRTRSSKRDRAARSGARLPCETSYLSSRLRSVSCWLLHQWLLCGGLCAPCTASSVLSRGT